MCCIICIFLHVCVYTRRLLNRQNVSVSGSTSLHHQQCSSASSLSDLHHTHQRCHGDDDDDDDELLLSDSDDFSDHQPTAAVAGRSTTPADETGSRCRSPDIEVDDDSLIDPAASPTISVGVSSRCSSPDPATNQQSSTEPLDSESACHAVPLSSTSVPVGSLDHHHGHRIHHQMAPSLGLGFGMTASALAGLYHQHQQHTRPQHQFGSPLIPPALPFPPTAGFAAFQPSLYPFSPLLSFSVTSPGPNR